MTVRQPCTGRWFPPGVVALNFDFLCQQAHVASGGTGLSSVNKYTHLGEPMPNLGQWHAGGMHCWQAPQT